FLASLYSILSSHLFSFTAPSPTDIYTLSLHDALPILPPECKLAAVPGEASRARAAEPRHPCEDATGRSRGADAELGGRATDTARSEEHTSELQSRFDLVCRLLLEKKKKNKNNQNLSK